MNNLTMRCRPNMSTICIANGSHVEHCNLYELLICNSMKQSF